MKGVSITSSHTDCRLQRIQGLHFNAQGDDHCVQIIIEREQYRSRRVNEKKTNISDTGLQESTRTEKKEEEIGTRENTRTFIGGY